MAPRLCLQSLERPHPCVNFGCTCDTGERGGVVVGLVLGVKSKEKEEKGKRGTNVDRSRLYLLVSIQYILR